MKNKNILLDTNAFIYLMRNEKECSNTISLENRQINESNFYDECKNANYLFITSQTLYEIFWQSIKKTKKIDQFAYYYDQIIKFKNKYNVKFSILNDTDGEFELRLFEDQYKDDMNLNDAIKLALTAINEATEHETTANNVEIAVIKCDEEVYTKLSQEEVQTFIDEVVSKEESEE